MNASAKTTHLRNRLLWRIHRRYATAVNEVRLGNLRFDFTRVADPDRVLDQVAEEADRREKITGRRQPDEQLLLPYWAELWDSAMGIGQFLEGSGFGVQGSGFRVRDSQAVDPRIIQKPGYQSPEPQPLNPDRRTLNPDLGTLNPEPRTPNPPSVLDLGCGMGFSGSIAAGLGARVLFADIEPAALLFARLNSLPWAGRARTRRVDWRSDRLGEVFDLILGADILYERTQWEFLEPFWRRHLAPAGRAVLGEPGRHTGDLFIDWIKPRGWRLDIAEEKVATRQRPIRIFLLQPRE